MKKSLTSLIVLIILIILCIIGIATLKTNAEILSVFVSIFNTIDKIIDLLFKVILVICGIMLVISAIIALIGCSKLGATSTNPQARAELLQKMAFTPTIIFQIFVFAVAIKVIFEIVIAILVRFI